MVHSKDSINVLGVQFDSKMNWNKQIAQSIRKAKKLLHAIRLIRNYFNGVELKQLITSNFYSVIYYNCEVWLISLLRPALKQQLLSASNAALKICGHMDWTTSFERMHSINKRATPMMMMKYNIA